MGHFIAFLVLSIFLVGAEPQAVPAAQRGRPQTR